MRLNAIKSYLLGRSSRREYWASAVGLAFGAICVLAIPGLTWAADAINVIVTVAWCLIAARRLRAAGLPIWLAPFPLVIGFVCRAAIRLGGSSDGLLVDTVWRLALLNQIGNLVTLVLIVILGCLPSKPLKVAPETQAEVFG